MTSTSLSPTGHRYELGLVGVMGATGLGLLSMYCFLMQNDNSFDART